jgi:hypothetical protein
MTSQRTKEEFLKLPKELRNLIAGGIAGMIAKSVVAPIDRIKILYQVSAKEFRVWDVPGVARKIIQEEGIEALWKGNTATLIRVFPYSGIQFMVFDKCKAFYLDRHDEHRARNPTQVLPNSRGSGLSPVESMIAGSIAGVVSVLCTYPLDVTRAQLAVIKRKKDAHNIGFVGILGNNYKTAVSPYIYIFSCPTSQLDAHKTAILTPTKGIRGIFRGITPTMLGILPYSGIAFALNEQGKREIRHIKQREPTTIERMQCGAISGLFAQTITYPLEVTRRRMQTMGFVKGKDAAMSALGMGGELATGDHSMVSTMRHLFHEQGLRGFFKGVSMNWIKGPIAFSISFTTFDNVQGLMETESERLHRLSR